jgi:hypothetical protein
MEASTAVHGLLQLQTVLVVVMTLVAETGLTLRTSLLELAALQLDVHHGTLSDPLQLSTEMHMETLLLEVALAVEMSRLVAAVTEPGEMASMLLDLPTHVWSGSFSA